MTGPFGKDVSTRRINEGTADRTDPDQRATDKQRRPNGFDSATC